MTSCWWKKGSVHAAMQRVNIDQARKIDRGHTFTAQQIPNPNTSYLTSKGEPSTFRAKELDLAYAFDVGGVKDL